MDKKGDQKYDIIISLVLGIIVIILVLFFLFNKYFTQEDIDWETCRQSIFLRATIPGDYVSDAKDLFSFKCKTSAFVITTKNKLEVAGYIANITANSFYASGEGKLEVFPRKNFKTNRNCIVFARITIDQKLREYYSQPENKIPIWSFLNENKIEGKTYLEYYYNSFVDNNKIKSCKLNSNSEELRKLTKTPLYWDNPSEDMFVTVMYMNKLVDSSLGFIPNIRIGGCDNFKFEWADNEVPPSAPFISNLKDLEDSCDTIVSIPA